MKKNLNEVYKVIRNIFCRRQNLISSKGCSKTCGWCKQDITKTIKMPPKTQIKYKGHIWKDYIVLGCSNPYASIKPINTQLDTRE